MINPAGEEIIIKSNFPTQAWDGKNALGQPLSLRIPNGHDFIQIVREIQAIQKGLDGTSSDPTAGFLYDGPSFKLQAPGINIYTENKVVAFFTDEGSNITFGEIGFGVDLPNLGSSLIIADGLYVAAPNGCHFNGGNPVRPTLSATPTTTEISTALKALGLCQ
jgi:hypothetical protein